MRTVIVNADLVKRPARQSLAERRRPQHREDLLHPALQVEAVSRSGSGGHRWMFHARTGPDTQRKIKRFGEVQLREVSVKRLPPTGRDAPEIRADAASWRSALQEQADPGGDQQDADEPDEGALREAGVDVAAQEQSGRYDGKSSRRGHERLPPEQPQDDKGDQPDTAVDEEVEGEGRAERPLLEIPQAQIDDVERASAAEQRPHET